MTKYRGVRGFIHIGILQQSTEAITNRCLCFLAQESYYQELP